MARQLSYGYQSDRQLVEVIPRRDFLIEFGHDYGDGQHVSYFGPTGRGKSTLCYQCLSRVISPDRQVISLHGKIKGRDPVVGKAAKQLNLRVVPALPSPTRMRYDRKRKYNGYLIVPLEKPGESVATENDLLRREFGRAIHDNYKTTDRKTITHINEAHQTQHELKLQTACEGPLMRGAPDNAEWNEAQRGRFLSYHTYSAPEHLFIFYDDDRDNRKRYADFGCADPDEIEWITSNLRVARARDGRTISQCLYVRRSGGMYVIDT
jgi:energy-coupling factor transporter ATP-binding protein EcfA2